MLKRSTKPLGLVCNVPFQRFLEAMEQSRGYTFEGGQAVICDPLNKSYWATEFWNLKHHQLCLQDMKQFVKVLSSVDDVVAQGLLTCSALQFKIC